MRASVTVKTTDLSNTTWNLTGIEQYKFNTTELCFPS